MNWRFEHTNIIGQMYGVSGKALFAKLSPDLGRRRPTPCPSRPTDYPSCFHFDFISGFSCKLLSISFLLRKLCL